MNKELLEIFKDTPDAITPSIVMSEPNQQIEIFEGMFKLSNGKHTVEIEGKIWFDWFPSINSKFRGKPISNAKYLYEFFDADHLDLWVNDLLFGKAYISNTGQEVFGEMHGLSVLGDKSIPVSKITFEVPNLRSFLGIPVKRISEDGGVSSSKDRLILENPDYKITIDGCQDHRKSQKVLEDRGGYYLLHSGEIVKKTGHIAFEEIKGLQRCLAVFLGFLNGRRCSPMFFSGRYEGERIWTDYSGYTCDPHKYVHSWPSKGHVGKGLNTAWVEFSKLWDNQNDRDFLNSAVHWYVEANSNSGYLEGSIIMTQTALELIYNWLIIERKKLLIGKDGENISASNKIRLLLSQFSTDTSLSASNKNIKKFLDSHQDIHDEIDLFVQIRNAIIHSQEDKRKKLSNIPHLVQYEVQQLGLWYIEVSLLNILKYKGKYKPRLSGKLWSGDDEEPFNP